MKFSAQKSLTFLIGLILFIAAFGVILVAGSIFNPPPYRIVIALEDIAPYTVLTRDMLAVDEQTMHQRVASRLVHETEIDRYLGGMVVEPIHGGEPLRRNAVVASDNPAAVHRLSLALTDPDLVAAVIPVSPRVIPDNVTAGDYANVNVGVAGSIGQWSYAGWGEPPTGGAESPSVPFTYTPGAAPGFFPAGMGEEVPEVAPPLEKIVLSHARVIHVTREKVPNPNYGMTLGQEGAQEPAFLEGDIESVTVLVPRFAEELLYFAVDNGTLHISIVPHAAVQAGTESSTGFTWEDFQKLFQQERLNALGVMTGTSGLPLAAPVPVVEVAPGSVVEPTSPVSSTPSLTATEPISSPQMPVAPTAAPTPQAATPGAEAGVLATPPVEPGAAAAGSGAGGAVDSALALGDSLGYLTPLCIGVALVFGLGAIGLAFMRRRKEASK
jgi:hypothetical protein